MVQISTVTANVKTTVDALIAALIRKRFVESEPVKLKMVKTHDYPGVSQARHALEDGGTSSYSQWLSAMTRLIISDTTIERLQSTVLRHNIRTSDLCTIALEAT